MEIQALADAGIDCSIANCGRSEGLGFEKILTMVQGEFLKNKCNMLTSARPDKL